ncbi:MAG: RluA family pseudouridine synthase [Burkholderiales bacterium]|nr:RluA family pseudouridine synthase [Burkholderiales bacterium]
MADRRKESLPRLASVKSPRGALPPRTLPRRAFALQPGGSENTVPAVAWTTIDDSAENQRIDNFLLRHLKGVPKSHIYRILRSGEVRVNSARVAADYRLVLGDRVRIPPVRVAGSIARRVRIPVDQRLAERILFEDEALLAIDKPAGLAVHGGSGVSLGAIEQLRAEFPQFRFLELAHRLDRDTSGVLLLAKKRSALVALHALLREGHMDKRYLTLVAGQWTRQRQAVDLPLAKYATAEGERRVAVAEQGQDAHTIFRLMENFNSYSLLEAELKTGRTHQIRVHLAHLGFPVVGDAKYGDFTLNKSLAKRRMKRMFLHAHRLSFVHPLSGKSLAIEAPLPEELDEFIKTLRRDPR